MEKNVVQAAASFSYKMRKFLPHGSDVLARFIRSQRTIPAREEIVSKNGAAYIVCEGWGCLYALMADGSRQIIDFRLPGDFLGLISILVRGTGLTLEAMTDIVVWEIDKAGLRAAIHENRRLSEAVMWALSRDAAIMSEHLINVGKRDAVARTAHLLLELAARLSHIGKASGQSYSCPLTQKDIAEALGITNVHLNRVLRHLREKGLVSFNGGVVTLHNMPVLERIAEFNPAYLDASN